MHTPPDVEEAIFAGAIQKEDPGERAVFVAAACGGDADLRRRVEDLLRAASEAHRFMEQPPTGRPEPRDAFGPGATGSRTGVAGARIGRYTLLEEIGEGGYGTVYRAEQMSPVHRIVALKVIKPGMDTRAVIARFDAERQALAMMDHPNIARVFDAGTTGADDVQSDQPDSGPLPSPGRPFFVMELVQGLPITQYCDEQRLTVTERVELFIPVCQAIQHAHQKGVLHRDIKPSNILVAVQDTKPVPKVIDFGIAKAIEGRLTNYTLFTQAEQIIGTPAYMSPEQADRGGQDVDTRSDVYSLGVVLYELLTGVVPFDSRQLFDSGLENARRILREVEPPTPSTRMRGLSPATQGTAARQRSIEPAMLRRRITGDLDWIVMKCLEKDRTRRYETVNGLAADLRRHLNHEPVIAGPPKWTYRLGKGVRRHRVAVTMATVIFLLLLAGISVSTSQAIRARRAVYRAERSEAGARESLYLAVMKQAPVAWAEGNTEQLRSLLDSVSNAPNLGLEWSIWREKLHQERRLFRGPPGPVTAAAFVAGGRRIVTSSSEGAVNIWDLATGEIVTPVGRTTGTNTVTRIPTSGSLIAIGDAHGTVRIYEGETGRELSQMETGSAGLQCLAISADGSRLLTSGVENVTHIWNLIEGKTLFTLPSRSGGASFSPNGQILVTSEKGTIRIWDAKTGLKLAVASAESPSEKVTFSSDGSKMLSGDPRGAILREPASGRIVARLDGQPQSVTTAELSPDGNFVATGDEGGTVRLYTTAGQLLEIFRGHSGRVLTAAFSPDSAQLLTGGVDGTARLWTLPSAPPLLAVRPGQAITAMTVAPGESRIASGGSDGVVRTWEAATGRELLALRGHAGPVNAVVFSPDGRHLFSGGDDSLLRKWDSISGRELALMPGHGTPVVSGVATQNPWRVVTAGSSGEVIVWDPTNGVVLTRIAGQADSAGTRAVTASADGRLVGIAGTNRFLSIWDTHTGTRRFQFESPAPIRSLALSPDGHRLVAGSLNDKSFVWDLEAGTGPLTLRGHQAPLETVQFLESGHRIVTIASDDTLRLWDAITGLELMVLGGRTSHPSGDIRCAFVAESRDGKRILFNRDREIRTIEATPDQDLGNWRLKK